MHVIILSLIFALASGCAAAGSSQNMSAKALEILEGTKQVTGSYAVYNWNRITPPNEEPVEEWSAEFHSGDLHRVETPRDRVIADCRARTGIALSLVTGEVVEGPQVAAAACGINTNASLSAAEWLGSVRSPFGEVQRVRLVDQEHVREYDVSNEGVLLRTIYSESKPDGQMLLTSEAVKLETTLPHMDIFDPESLNTSFVPEEYKQRSLR